MAEVMDFPTGLPVDCLASGIVSTAKHYTGFPDKTSATDPSSISWDDSTYTLTLAPSSSTHNIYINGVKYAISSLTKQLTVAQEAATGLYWFWLTATAGVVSLNCSTTQPGFDVCLVATVYWNTTTSKGILSDERHWYGRDKWMHEYLHETIGARFAVGLTGTFTDTTFEVGAGEFYDEDIEHDISAQTTCKVLYHNGDADWAWVAGSTTPYKTVNPGVDDTLQYNNGNSLATVDNNKYVNMWVFITPDMTHSVHIVIGTAQYATIALARAATVPSLGTLGTAENKLIYKVTYQNNGGTPDYIETTDYRTSSNLPVSSYVAPDHGALTGLSDDDHTQYLLVNGTRDMTGYAVLMASQMQVDNSSTYIDKDGSGNMTFTDAVTGTRTLKQLGCPTYKKLTATGQSAGSLNLTHASWGISKSWLKRLVITIASGSSSDYDVAIYEKDTFAASLVIYSLTDNNDSIDIILDCIYEDQDDTDELHIKITDNDGTGSPTFDIEVRGIELL
jgi:hypothetical protein